MGFQQSKVDMSLFYKIPSNALVYLLVYVDNIVITRSDEFEVYSLIFALNSKFALKYLRLLSYFLGVGISYLPNGNQCKYIRLLLIKAGMETTNSISTLMSTSTPLSIYIGESYLVGAL